MKTRFENINIDNSERLTLVECSASDHDVPSSSITRGIALCPSARHVVNTGPEVIKSFFMLNSFDHEICSFHTIQTNEAIQKKSSCSYEMSMKTVIQPRGNGHSWLSNHSK